MADFAVDIEALTALGSDLERSREQLGAALAVMRDIGAASLGTDGLDRACQEFQESWAYGLGRLGECIDAVRAGVEATALAYAEVDRGMAEGFGQMRLALEPR